MTRVKTAACASAVGALLALALCWTGLVSFMSLSTLSPFNARPANQQIIAADVQHLTSAANLSATHEVRAPSTLALDLLSLWRAGDRAGVLVVVNGGPPHQLRVGENLGDIRLDAVRDGRAEFSSPGGEFSLRVHQHFDGRPN